MLDLFWEDGGYIFNATTVSDQLLVGDWNYKNCVLNLAYSLEKVEMEMHIKVASLDNDILKVNLKGGSNNVVFKKHGI